MRGDIEGVGPAHIFYSQWEGVLVLVHVGHAQRHWYANDMHSVPKPAYYHYSVSTNYI